MHDDRTFVEARLRRFVSSRLEPALYCSVAPVLVDAWPVPGEPVPFAEATAGEYRPLAIGDPWGRAWGTVWLHVTGAVPADWLDHGERSKRFAAELVVDLGFHGNRPGSQSEGLVYTPDGRIVKGIEPRNTYVPLDAGPIDFYIEAAANPDVAGGFADGFDFAPTLLGEWQTAGDEPLYRLTRLEVGLRDLEVWELLQDIGVLDGLMRELPLELPRRHEILRALERMLDVMNPDDIAGTVLAGREALAGALARPAYASSHHLVGVGHAHIDSAWLWPVRETVRKCARTFSNVLALMDADPDFVFACSSAQQLAWIQAGYPQLFERIKQKVAAGQFIPVGGMWVESDTNMPGGEAMARQFVAGKRFFLEQLGVDTEEVWLPDSFGYSASLPQIARAAGARWFLTQKISWNQTNAMPHHTFRWEGIDGSQIFTHFPPVDTYSSEVSAAELAHAERNFRDKGRATMSLLPFGWGDGGGGPTREMLAAVRRTSSLEGSPTVEIAPPSEFFTRAQAEYPDPPVWSGELYLEFHRGTYTSQARTKQGNRRSEHLLREAELWATTAAVRSGSPYPYDELERAWRTVLLQQFHDILPGSSIAWVHKEAERNYTAVAATLEAVIADALTAAAGPGEVELVANAAPHALGGVPALGISSTTAPAGEVRTTRQDGFTLDNGLISVAVDERGLIVSLVDAVTGRQAIAPGAAGNLLQLHRDTPNVFDAWEIEEFYRRNVTDLVDLDSIELETDASSATVVITRSFGASRITQRLRLEAGSSSVEITNRIDWREREKLLKLAFPLDVHADRYAAETQFGHVYRATHSNTSWDYARFETCAHRWVHVGEPGYGVAVANDASYGHDVGRQSRDAGGTTTTVRLSLLRAPRYPDPESDQGVHTMTVSIRPAASIADAVEEGYQRNLRPRAVRGSTEVEPILTISDPAVVVEAVKLAEDRSGDVVVRIYESLGAKASTTITAGFPFSTAVRTDLLERELPIEHPILSGGSITMNLRPFELVTLRFRR
jgi:alpha-mannosidase